MTTERVNLFSVRSKIEDRVEANVIMAEMFTIDTYEQVIKAIDDTKAMLPGVVLCRAIITGQLAETKQRFSRRVYLAASKAGAVLHIVKSIGTDIENGEVYISWTLEGGDA